MAYAESDANPYSMQPSTVGPESWTSGGKTSTSSLRTSENAFVTDTEARFTNIRYWPSMPPETGEH